MLARFFSKPVFVTLLLWAAIGMVAYFLTNILVMPYFAGKFLGKVHVPALVSLQPDKAKDILKAKDLIFMLDSTGDYSNAVAAGKIMSQYPQEGTEVKKGRRIWVRISKGLRSLTVPVLRGLSLRQAEITLQQLGLKMGRVREVRMSNIPAGAVIGSFPKANATVEKGRSVDIEISQENAPAPSGMPNLTGLTLAQAKDQVRSLGLEVGVIKVKSDPRNLPNTILAQNPLVGESYVGKVVNLVISK